MAILSKAVRLFSSVGIAAAIGLTSGLALAQDSATVAVTAIVEHPALDATRDGGA